MKRILEKLSKVNSVHLMAIVALLQKLPTVKVSYENGEVIIDLGEAAYARINVEKSMKIVQEVSTQGNDIIKAFDI